MIKTIPFNDLFNPINIEKITIPTHLGSSCFIAKTSLINKLMMTPLPIKNQRIAIKNILEFLHYVDDKIEMSNSNKNILPISKEKIIPFFGEAKNYKKYLKILKELKVITDVPYEDGTFYKVGSHNKHYQLFTTYVNDKDLSLVIFEDNKKPVFTNELPKLDKRFIDTIKKIEIDLPKAIYAEILHHQNNDTDLNDLKTRINRIFYTKRKKYIKQGQKVARVYHSFTNVSKVARKHFNKDFCSIDIVNCQPLLLVYYLISNNLPIDDNYISDCENGIFYEQFITSKIDRENIKPHIYKSILFDFQDRYNVNKRFKELYPKTWAAIQSIQASDVSLAAELQNIESNLFNNLIPVKSKYYYTLFDAIYYDNVFDLLRLKQDIKSYFNSLGLSVTLKFD